MFHLIGALSQYGKVGVVCIGSTLETAYHYYAETIRVLQAECCGQIDGITEQPSM